MSYQRALVIGLFFVLLLPSITSAHDQKEYNILITENGLTPSLVNPGILVETDTLFFRNLDDREHIQHKILVDADLASNSASWQWIAGCGADAAPYFRIFNPVKQGIKFDPQGLYTKKYIPELKDLPDKYLSSTVSQD